MIVILGAALLASVSPASARPGAANSAYRVGGDGWQMFTITNETRDRFDRRQLTLDREMSLAALRHSRAMARHGELFHTTDVGVYLDGVGWQTWGENVGYTSGDLSGLQQAFMASPPHRSNILKPGFRHAAVGAVRVDGVLWVTVFFYA